jgi:hypothetical protein
VFADEPTERTVRRVPIWRWRELQDRPSSDLVIVQGSRLLIRRLPQRHAIVLPEFVHHVLDLSGDLSAVEGRLHRKLLRTIRQAQKHGYQLDVSQSDRDFDEFYRRMALPTTRMRHGELSTPMPRYEAYQYFRRGLLFRIRRDGDWVAGAVCQSDQGTLLGQILGVRWGDPQEMKMGVLYALHYAVIRWANEHGYRSLDFLETGPYLESGLFQNKRRWGTTVSVPYYTRRQTWLQARRVTPALAGFLKENPFVIVDAENRLHGLIAVDDPASVPAETRLDWEKRYATPGLDSLIVRAVGSFVESRHEDLVLPVSVANGQARA